MIDMTDAFYVDGFARALIDRDCDHFGQDYTVNHCHSVAITVNIPRDPPGLLPNKRSGVAFKALQSIISNPNWGGAKEVAGKIIYAPYSAVITLSYPIPTREERYFQRGDRERFLKDYSFYLVAQAISRALAGYNPELQERLRDAYPNPRHPRDIKLQAIKGALKDRWRSLTGILGSATR